MSVMADIVAERRRLPAASQSETRTGTTIPLWAIPLAALFLLVIYAIGYDQGLLLYPVVGDASMKANYLHEFAHDGRHLLAFACH